MANYVREVQRHDSLRGGTRVHTTAVTEHSADQGIDRLQRFIYYLISVGSGLLFIRFILALFGANPANMFADFVYTLTDPLVRPFQNLFGFNDVVNGVARFEAETITAIVVYSFVGWVLASALNLARKDTESVDLVS